MSIAPNLPPQHTADPSNFDMFENVAASVQAEVASLQLQGLDVELVHLEDEYRLAPDRQAMLDNRVAELEMLPDGAEQFRSLPALSKWAPLTKRAIALHTLYEPYRSKVGEGISNDAYAKPLFSGLSAAQVLRAKRPQDAETWINYYDEFVPAVIDDGDANTLGSRDFFIGVKDSAGVRTRATAGMNMFADHIYASTNLHDRQDLVSASLACGAAGPVYKLVNRAQELGVNFSNVILVDQDPFALATAESLADEAGVADKVELHLKDLLRDNITDYIAPHSVDVVDLLGLFEYIPDGERVGPWATELLKKVREIVRPGGMIIFGNMLNERPQQSFFKRVVQWPRLHQRKIGEVLSIIDNAGFDLGDVSVRIPSEGVYAVYGIKVPELVASEINNASVVSRIGKKALADY